LRQVRFGLFTAVAALAVLSPELDILAADPGNVGGQQRLQAKGWLQLKQDQKTYRENVEPLAPRDAARLDRLELRQQGRARELEQRQRRSLSTGGNRRRGIDVERPASRPRNLESRRQLDRQRLDMRIQRETLRPGRP
jgi:hypothetical protein